MISYKDIIRIMYLSDTIHPLVFAYTLRPMEGFNISNKCMCDIYVFISSRIKLFYEKYTILFSTIGTKLTKSESLKTSMY